MQTIDADIGDIARTIWDTLFELSLEPGGEGVGFGRDSTVASLVHIDGAWQGVVVLQCPMALAVTLTKAMFLADGPPTPDEIRDAIGELANMVAGNLKSLLPAPSGISLPATVFGSDYQLGVAGTAEVASVPFTCDGHLLVITLMERSGLADSRSTGSQ